MIIIQFFFWFERISPLGLIYFSDLDQGLWEKHDWNAYNPNKEQEKLNGILGGIASFAPHIAGPIMFGSLNLNE